MDASKQYSGTEDRPRCWARVKLTVEPAAGVTEVALGPAVADRLRALFGEHFEHGCQCVLSGVACQIAMANVAGEMPRVGRSAFRAEVVEVELVSSRDWRESGWLLGEAAMAATRQFLFEFEAAGG